jgi:ribosomal protein S18 acetylase RimI-like enzyme
MVEPSYRRQGIATQLMGEILPVLLAQRIATLIFSVPSETSTDWMLERGAIFIRREYQMQRQGIERALITNEAISVRLATATDEPILYAIDNACFPEEQSAYLFRFSELLQDPSYKIFIVEKNKTPIGKAHLHIEAEGARLTDIAVLPHYQGRGYGSAMLAYCVNYSLAENQSTLTLDVEIKNQQALKLYDRLGFLVTNACDFWSIPIEVLRSAKH